MSPAEGLLYMMAVSGGVVAYLAGGLHLTFLFFSGVILGRSLGLMQGYQHAEKLLDRLR